MVDISVIIVNYRGWKHLEKCLDAFESFNGNSFSFEVIIVDNCSNDGLLPVFQQRFPKYQFVENSGNNGFANGCNLGAKKSSGEQLLFLNSDIIATESALYRLLQTIRNEPGLFILSCKQQNNKGAVEQTDRLFPSIITFNGILRSAVRYFRKSGANTSNEVIYSDWVSGSVVLISRINFDSLGGWNEKYWLYYEDVDLCKRAANSGGKIGLHTGVCVLHNHGGSTRLNLKTASLTKTEVIISSHVYFSAHYSGFNSFVLHALIIFNSLVIRSIPALLGIPLFFIRKLRLYRNIYVKISAYYFNAIRCKTWLSPRSPEFKRIYRS